MLKIYYSKILNNFNYNLDIFPSNIVNHLNKKTNELSYKTSLYSWYLLDYILKKDYNLSLNDIDVSFSENGKPLSSKINFSITHANNLCVIGISSSNIGIDIEEIKEDLKVKKLAKKLIKDYDEKSNVEYFYRLFTSYEAYIKFNDLRIGYPKNNLVLIEDVISFKILCDKTEYMISFMGEKNYKKEEIFI